MWVMGWIVHLLEKVKEQIDYLQIFFILFNLYARVFEERFIVYCIWWYGLLSPYVIFTSNVYISEDEKFYSYILPVNAYS